MTSTEQKNIQKMLLEAYKKDVEALQLRKMLVNDSDTQERDAISEQAIILNQLLNIFKDHVENGMILQEYFTTLNK
tara:strand:+ start:449 stop:676 length:228 start_codon:yes stop_codon:yes gene_type:complete